MQIEKRVVRNDLLYRLDHIKVDLAMYDVVVAVATTALLAYLLSVSKVRLLLL